MVVLLSVDRVEKSELNFTNATLHVHLLLEHADVCTMVDNEKSNPICRQNAYNSWRLRCSITPHLFGDNSC